MSQPQPCLPVSRKRPRDHNDGRKEIGKDDNDNQNDDSTRHHHHHQQGTKDEEQEGLFDDISTMDAAEYLARVVQQADRLPDIFVASQEDEEEASDDKILIPARFQNHVPIDGSAASLSYLVSSRTALTPPPSRNFLPLCCWGVDGWVQDTLHNFESLRDYLEDCKTNKGVGGKQTQRIPVPPMKDRAAWHIFCVGRDEARGNVNSYFDDSDNDNDDENDNGDPSDGKHSNSSNTPNHREEVPEWQAGLPDTGHTPSVRLLCQMDQVMVRQVLGHLSQYIQQGWSPTTNAYSAWIYALLARLEKPIHRDDAAVMFGLLKVLTRLRSQLENVPVTHDHNDDNNDNDIHNNTRQDLAKLNVLITLIGIYFEQGGREVMKVQN